MQPPEWSKIRVLVADDENHIREIVGTWFGLLGCRVDQAPNARTALALLSEQPHDVLISDVRMPGGDGTRLVCEMKDKGIQVPAIVFISGYADLPVEEVYDLGVEAILQKPCPRKDLIASVERCLQDKAQLWSGPPPNTSARLARELPSLEAAQRTGQLSFGQGGFFVSGEQDHYPGQIVRFELSFVSGETPLAGTGLVRWQREPHGAECAGTGVEILGLDPGTMQWFLDYLRRLQPAAYIPRGICPQELQN